MNEALTIAGLDSNGSAGMSADLHSFFADHVYGHSVLTGAVAENATRITAEQGMPVSFIQQQLLAQRDFPIQAVKTGMLATSEVIKTVVDNCADGQFGPLVVDPVIVTKQGDRLLADDAFSSFCDLLIPSATVITPNFVEAQELTGQTLTTPRSFLNAARQLQRQGAQNVVIKGQHPQHGQDRRITTLVLLADGQSFWLKNRFMPGKKVNGAGDTFSAIIAAELAKGSEVRHAIVKANDFVAAAIDHPLNIGKAFMPLNHWAGQNWLFRNEQ